MRVGELKFGSWYEVRVSGKVVAVRLIGAHPDLRRMTQLPVDTFGLMTDIEFARNFRLRKGVNRENFWRC
jgi:hypothetical protein